MNTQLIKLFKAVEVKNHEKQKASKSLLAKTISKGFVFAPEVIANYSEKELNLIIDLVEKYFGLNAEKLNAGLHKSWKKVANSSIEQLVLEQVIHYITTYGFEALEIYDERNVYIPSEKLEIPDLKENINLFVINGYTRQEIKDKLINLLSSGIAFGEDTVKDLIAVALTVGIDANALEQVKNKEVKIAFYDYLGLIPNNCVEFLRFVIYKTIGKTLLIKDKATIELIKKSEISAFPIFKRFEKEYGLDKLSESFHRFKPLFLAFRGQKEMRPIINKIRKLATFNHKPMPEDLLNNITARLNDNESVKNLAAALDKANFFRKSRLAHALNFRTCENHSILYRIRNGKGFATSFDFNKHKKAQKALDIVNDSILNHFKKYKGATVFIPNHIDYALPTTQKQFVGEIPSGSSVTVKKDMVLGVNWNNVNNNRIDLDLSLISIDGKFGWDGMYRGGDKNSQILFSGDMTDASGEHGATEAFYVSKQFEGTFLLVLNYFNAYETTEVPFKLFVASENVKDFKKNYLVNPNNVTCIANTKVVATQKQKILGLLHVADDQSKFTFVETSIGGAISAKNNEYMNHSRQYIMNYYKNQLNIRNFLEMAGAKFSTNPKECDINLSPFALEKDTFINLAS